MADPQHRPEEVHVWPCDYKIVTATLLNAKVSLNPFHTLPGLPSLSSDSRDHLSVRTQALIPLQSSRSIHPIACWMAPLGHLKAILKSCTKTYFFDDYRQALISSTKTAVQAKRGPHLPSPPSHSQLILESCLLQPLGCSWSFHLPPIITRWVHGQKPSVLLSFQPKVYPEARGIFQKCQSNHVTCHGAAPA